MRIIIAEDERLIAMGLAAVLRELGHEVQAICSSGVSCVQKERELRPDLVFMDICMETRMSGIEAARKIRETGGAPVIFTTAYDDSDTAAAAAGTEPAAFLVKPLMPKDIEDALRSLRAS
ncbi:MAG TPA: response regulator [Spirochaetia bacterium]|nr:response regulator [Spirochaetales bacterium]HRY80490.1 response regulator [Spirochaetia bacterium]